jgi:hypothetical protein
VARPRSCGIRRRVRTTSSSGSSRAPLSARPVRAGDTISDGSNLRKLPFIAVALLAGTPGHAQETPAR